VLTSERFVGYDLETKTPGKVSALRGVLPLNPGLWVVAVTPDGLDYPHGQFAKVKTSANR
jgi:hypothetical protein